MEDWSFKQIATTLGFVGIGGLFTWITTNFWKWLARADDRAEKALDREDKHATHSDDFLLKLLEVAQTQVSMHDVDLQKLLDAREQIDELEHTLAMRNKVLFEAIGWLKTLVSERRNGSATEAATHGAELFLAKSTVLTDAFGQHAKALQAEKSRKILGGG